MTLSMDLLKEYLFFVDQYPRSSRWYSSDSCRVTSAHFLAQFEVSSRLANAEIVMGSELNRSESECSGAPDRDPYLINFAVERS